MPWVHVEPVHDLPQGGHRLERVAVLERRQLVRVHLDHTRQLAVAVDELALRLGEFRVHVVLHAGHDVVLRSPSVPMTMRSSTMRFALSSNRGSEPFSARLTPKRSDSCASASSFASAPHSASASTSADGTSTSTSIWSRRPSSVYRWIWN